MSRNANKNDKPDFMKIGETDFQNMQNKLSKHGYADGVNDGREAEFQSAFDRGYAAGLLAGFELEKYRKFNETLREADSQALNEENIRYQHMELPKMESKTDSNLALNKALVNFAKELPLSTDLLKISQPN